MIQVGQKAPEFLLGDQNEIVHTLSQQKGKWVILYFYPKDDTPGCIREACGFRDVSETFKRFNAVIFGVSKDTVASHKKFADKYQLPFPILSDPEGSTIRAYGAWGTKKFMGKNYEGIYRITYLINPQGIMQKVYEHVNPLSHAQTIIQDITKINGEQ